MALLVATPPTRVTGLPKFVPSIWNCTVPVGVPTGWLAATVAVKVTGRPEAEGLATEGRKARLYGALDVVANTLPTPPGVNFSMVSLP